MDSESTPSAWWQDFKAALALLTRLPGGVTQVSGMLSDHEDSARACRAYPLVGLVVGALGGALFWIASLLSLPALLAALLAVAATAWITGALHEDGLADVADGFGGGRDRDHKLAIMRDHRTGAYGALALVFSVAIRATALAAIAGSASDQSAASLLTVVAALIASHAVARAFLPTVMALLPLARADGLAADTGRPDARHAGSALLLGWLLAVLALGFQAGLVVLIVAGLVVFSVGLLARRQIGGYTGDLLGAAEQTAEAFVLITIVAML